MGKNKAKKLVLSRETVRDLTSQDLEHVDGGITVHTLGKGCFSKTVVACLESVCIC